MDSSIVLSDQSNQKQRSVAADPDEKLFPALIEWRNAKIKDLTYCLATLFNYLAIPRIGFLEVSRIPESSNIPPIITLEMVQYLLREIFPCISMTKEGMFEIFRVPGDIEASITESIIQHIKDKSFFTPIKTNKIIVSATDDSNLKRGKKTKVTIPPLEIGAGVTQTIWTYISNGIDSLASDSESDEDVRDKINEAQKAVLSKRNSSQNYGFNDELENAAFQALLYVIIALADWLEIDQITENEVISAYKILVPPDLQHDLEETKNTTLTDIIVPAIVDRGLIPTDKAVGLLISIMIDIQRYMEKLNTNDNARRIINRFMSFAQMV